MPYDEDGLMPDSEWIDFPAEGSRAPVRHLLRVLTPETDPSALRDVFALKKALQRVSDKTLSLAPTLPPATIEQEDDDA